MIAFPHMFARLMAARDDRALKGVFRLYPPALLLLWLAAVMIGVVGALVEPGLAGRASDRIFSIVTEQRLPAGFTALGLVAVLAAVMSTLDAQLLTLGSMLSRDVPRLAGVAGWSGGVAAGRLFGVIVAVAVLGLRELVETWPIVRVATFAFSGYVTLVPTLYLGVAWRRFTGAGAVASIVAGNAALMACEAAVDLPFGVLPGFVAFLAAAITAVLVSLATRPPSGEALARAFGADPGVPGRSGVVARLTRIGETSRSTRCQLQRRGPRMRYLIPLAVVLSSMLAAPAATGHDGHDHPSSIETAIDDAFGEAVSAIESVTMFNLNRGAEPITDDSGQKVQSPKGEDVLITLPVLVVWLVLGAVFFTLRFRLVKPADVRPRDPGDAGQVRRPQRRGGGHALPGTGVGPVRDGRARQHRRRRHRGRAPADRGRCSG